ncbi:hypothetical protein PATA110616_21130 [Paenibacillus tarimensis]
MNRYTRRIDQVIRYMEDNLSQKISLDQLAEISLFSKYHFSRIFSSVTGSTPLAYLTVIRLNRAARHLIETDMSILDISVQCGFDSLSNFNAAFKKHFHKTPSQLRKEYLQNRNIPSVDGNKQGEPANPPRYDEDVHHSLIRRVWQMNITITELKDMEVAYVRHVGSYLDTYQAWGIIVHGLQAETSSRRHICTLASRLMIQALQRSTPAGMMPVSPFRRMQGKREARRWNSAHCPEVCTACIPSMIQLTNWPSPTKAYMASGFLTASMNRMTGTAWSSA